MYPVNHKELKGKFKDRKDKDIDNDGDTDSSDEYLHKRRKAVSKAIGKIKEAAKKCRAEEVELDEAKTDIYHKHMLKALGKSRLPKNHAYRSAIANNGDFVVHDGGGRVVGRIPKGEHNLKEAVEVSHARYMRAHGKKARDPGHSSGWFFTHKNMDHVNNYDDPKEVHFHQGRFSDAKKSAQKWAKSHGHSTVYVMEETLDEKD